MVLEFGSFSVTIPGWMISDDPLNDIYEILYQNLGVVKSVIYEGLNYSLHTRYNGDLQRSLALVYFDPVTLNYIDVKEE